ncbi:WD40 repeat domain-containing protein [Zavarzinella formosa]|uniref:WD40 repeat domain-containing protein n=1 Tax=Zavarzinella formosa TaxID=360055 RepID=UPI000316368D|nr:PQQ-binding-like beta-propeller repeat protein [Zavarzinella formosa]
MFRWAALCFLFTAINLQADPPTKLEGHEQELYSLVFSPKGDRLASTANDGTIRVWKLADGQSTIIKTGTGSRTVAFSMDGKQVAGRFENKAVIWDASTGKPVAMLVGSDPSSDGTVMRVAFSPDGQHLAVGHQMGLVRIWDITTGKPIADLARSGKVGDLSRSITALAYSPDGKLLAVGGDKGLVVWNAGTNTVSKELAEFKTFSVEFTPDGKRLIVNGEDRVPVLQIRDTADWTTSYASSINESADRHLNKLRRIDDVRALGVNEKDEFELFDLQKLARTTIRFATPYKRGPGGFAISPDGKTVAHYFGGNQYAIHLQPLPK